MTQQMKKIMIVILVAVLAVSAIALLANGKKKKEEKPAEMPEQKTQAEMIKDEMPALTLGGKEYRYSPSILSYLIIGTDDSGEQAEEGFDYIGRSADFLLLLTVDVKTGKYGYLQINRDTMTDVTRPGWGSGDPERQQICTAHWYGQNEEECDKNTVNVVSTMLGNLQIDGYYTIHMSDVGRLNDAVGGVKLTIDEDLTAADPSLEKGKTLVLDDIQAQTYVRARMNVGDGENTSRMRRQRVYLTAFLDQALAKLKANPSFVNDLFSELEGIAVTDISGEDISVIAESIRTGESCGILQIEGKVKMGIAPYDGEEHSEFHAKTASIVKQMKTLYSLESDEDEADADNAKAGAAKASNTKADTAKTSDAKAGNTKGGNQSKQTSKKKN